MKCLFKIFKILKYVFDIWLRSNKRMKQKHVKNLYLSYLL